MPFGGGVIGDWICHVLDPAFWALDLDAPTSIKAEVTGYDLAKHGLTYPPGTRVSFEFPAKNGRGPVQVVWHDGNTTIPKPDGFPADEQVPGTGAILFGEKGMLVHGSHGGANCHLLPEELMEQHSGKNAPPEKIERVKGHGSDWIEAIRTGRPAGSNFDYGGPLTQVAMLGLIALRFPGQTLHWDDRAMKFTNLAAANELVQSSYREGWSL
jgi:predicted dehydrogenase